MYLYFLILLPNFQTFLLENLIYLPFKFENSHNYPYEKTDTWDRYSFLYILLNSGFNKQHRDQSHIKHTF